MAERTSEPIGLARDRLHKAEGKLQRLTEANGGVMSLLILWAIDHNDLTIAQRYRLHRPPRAAPNEPSTAEKQITLGIYRQSPLRAPGRLGEDFDQKVIVECA